MSIRATTKTATALSLNRTGHCERAASNEDRALDALTLAWGNCYEIYITDGQWQAWHDDAPDGEMLTGTTPGELNRKIREDWSRRPAPEGTGSSE